jgi:hypothetical protein
MVKQHFAISDTLLYDDENHENNNLGNENTLWSDIGVKWTSINTNSSTTCNKTGELDIKYNDGYNGNKNTT